MDILNSFLCLIGVFLFITLTASFIIEMYFNRKAKYVSDMAKLMGAALIDFGKKTKKEKEDG